MTNESARKPVATYPPRCNCSLLPPQPIDCPHDDWRDQHQHFGFANDHEILDDPCEQMLDILDPQKRHDIGKHARFKLQYAAPP